MLAETVLPTILPGVALASRDVKQNTEKTQFWFRKEIWFTYSTNEIGIYFLAIFVN